ncbi:MAG: hypothetical protein M5U25_10900 [Planctomycetota bacterium]|nr:hypothetical protein [Planctomycetota bacterium]
MPRELGKAKRADLTGHFPGEQAEYGSALARFLEGAGQLKPLGEGSCLDGPSGNGNGHATEVPGMLLRGDTEVAGNGAGSDTHFDLNTESLFGDAEMTPEPGFDTEAPLAPQGEMLDLEPVTFEPSADTLAPAAPEPEMLDSVPDLTSPEHDQLLAEDDESSPAARDLAPATSGDTGMLVAEAFGIASRDRLTDEDLTADDDWTGLQLDREEDERPTDKLAPRAASGAEEDPTDLLQRDDATEEKITSKVEPRRDVDPRTRDPNAVVRDTVNFYNQTQSLYEQKQRSGGFPTISPNVVNSGSPLGLRREEPPRAPQPDLLAEEEADTLSPGPMLEPALSPEDGETLGPDEEPTLAPDWNPSLSPVEGPALDAVAELSAENDLDDADKRETDKFLREDREPPDLPLPEGTDKIDKAGAPARKAPAGAEPRGLEPLADEKVAGGKDTQRFYVADILARKEPGSDTTAELQPAEQGPPPARRARRVRTTSPRKPGTPPGARPGAPSPTTCPRPQTCIPTSSSTRRLPPPTASSPRSAPMRTATTPSTKNPSSRPRARPRAACRPPRRAPPRRQAARRPGARRPAFPRGVKRHPRGAKFPPRGASRRLPPRASASRTACRAACSRNAKKPCA